MKPRSYRATGHQATERAERRRDREAPRPVRKVDFTGHTRHWFDGPPPSRLIAETLMEQQTPDYQDLRPAR